MSLQITDVFTFLSVVGDRFMDIVTHYIPRIILSIAVYVVGKLVINWISYSAKKILSKRGHDPSLQSFLNSLIKVSLQIFLIVTVLGMMGINLTSFAAILAGLAVGIGAALNGTLGNFAGGIMMLLFKPFKIGDFIEAQGYSGRVIEQGIFNTYLLSAENKTVILANGALSTGTIVNQSKHGNLKMDMQIAVPLNVDFNTVKNIILGELSENTDILKDPSANVNIFKIEDSTMIITISLYCLQENQGDVYHDLQLRFKNLLQKHGIENLTKSKIR